jgi:hypothetical protein
MKEKEIYLSKFNNTDVEHCYQTMTLDSGFIRIKLINGLIYKIFFESNNKYIDVFFLKTRYKQIRYSFNLEKAAKYLSIDDLIKEVDEQVMIMQMLQ